MTFLKYSIINYNFFFFKQFYNVFFFKKALHFYNNFFFKQNYNTLFFKLNKQHFLPSNNLTLMGLDDQKLFFFFKYFLYKNKFFFISRGIGTNIVLLQWITLFKQLIIYVYIIIINILYNTIFQSNYLIK